MRLGRHDSATNSISRTRSRAPRSASRSAQRARSSSSSSVARVNALPSFSSSPTSHGSSTGAADAAVATDGAPTGGFFRLGLPVAFAELLFFTTGLAAELASFFSFMIDGDRMRVAAASEGRTCKCGSASLSRLRASLMPGPSHVMDVAPREANEYVLAHGAGGRSPAQPFQQHEVAHLVRAPSSRARESGGPVEHLAL